MTERTLRDQIASLPRYMSDEIGMDRCPTGDWIKRDAVLALLDAHTAEQPAPDAVAEAAKVLLEAMHSDQVQGAVDAMHGMLPVGTARNDAQSGATFFLDALAKGYQP